MIQSLANIGDYQEVLPLVLEAGGIDITNSLLLHKNKFIVVGKWDVQIECIFTLEKMH